MRQILILFPLLTNNGYCGKILPNIEDSPIFVQIFNSPRVNEAAQKSQRAFLMQSGLSDKYTLVDETLSKKAKKKLLIFKRNIRENTILNPDYLFFMATATYTVKFKKEYILNIKNPIISDMTHSFTLGENHITIGLGLIFH